MVDNKAYLSTLPGLWQQACAQLQQQTDISQLVSQSVALSRQRCAAPAAEPTLLSTVDAIPAALWRTELLLSLSSLLNWPKSIRTLLVSSSYCCSLSANLTGAKAQPKLAAYPPLYTANVLAAELSPLMLQLLAGCYASARKIPLWRQQACSVLLTLAWQLQPPTAELSLKQQLAERIIQSRCEYELALLRQLLQLMQSSELTPEFNLMLSLQSSQFQRWLDTDNKTLFAILAQSDALSAPVLQLASQLNRQQRDITDVRLAINLIGRDQLSAVLTDAELNALLSQLNHPKQAMLQQLTHCFASCLQLLFADTISLATSRALARCLCAPLWLDSQHYCFAMVSTTQHGPASLLSNKSYLSAASTALIQRLLQHYQLHDWQSAVTQFLQHLDNPSTPANHSALMLQLAWLSCQAVYSGQVSPDLAALLKLRLQPVADTTTPASWLTTVATTAQAQCPLLLTL